MRFDVLFGALATSCPVAWARPNMVGREWQRIAGAHANCYLAAHLQTQTQSQSQTQTGTGTVFTGPTATSAASSTAAGLGNSPLRLLARLLFFLALFLLVLDNNAANCP